MQWSGLFRFCSIADMKYVSTPLNFETASVLNREHLLLEMIALVNLNMCIIYNL